MRRQLVLTVTVILILAVIPSTAFPAATRAGVEAQRRAEDITTAITISAEQTRRQVKQSEVAIQALYRRLETQTALKRIALRRANLSDKERRRLEVELSQLRKEQRAIITELTAKDVEYAASIRAFREGLTGLLEENDPRIVAILERYADGDARAADELQEWTRVIRSAREAGLRARNGSDQRAVARIWLDEKDKGHKTTAQVLAAWQEAASIDPDDFEQWIVVAHLKQQAGNLSGARDAANRARTLATKKYDLGVALTTIGDVAVAQGRLSDARTAFDESLILRRELKVVDPGSDRADRDLALSLERVGDVAIAEGRLSDSRMAYEESLVLSLKLLTDNPRSGHLNKDFSLKLIKVGEVAVAQGRLTDARTAFEHSLTLSRELLAERSGSVELKRVVCIGLNKIGNVAVIQGRLEDARLIYEELLTLSRELLATDSSSSRLTRDVSVSLSKTGDVAIAQGRVDDARAAYEEALMLSRTLLKLDLTNSVAKRDVSLSLDRLGDMAAAQGRLDAARASHEESLELRLGLLAASPSSVEAKRDVGLSLERLGLVAVAQGRLADARMAYEEMLTLSLTLLAEFPSSADAKRDVMIAHIRLSQVTEEVEHLTAALSLAEELERGGALAQSDQPLLEALRAHFNGAK